MIRFTLADLERANAEWRCNCGPAALAAICELTLEEARPLFPDFDGWASPRMMFGALERSGRAWRPLTLNATPSSRAARAWPRYGLALIAFEGPWTAPNPARERWLKIERSKRTHWVGIDSEDVRVGGVAVWDINAVDDVTKIDNGWAAPEVWERYIVPALTASIKRATGGWHITHAIEVERR